VVKPYRSHFEYKEGEIRLELTCISEWYVVAVNWVALAWIDFRFSLC